MEVDSKVGIETGLRFLGDRIQREDLKLIQEVVASCDGLSRMELARTVCELMGWRRRSESLKARECREFLEKLEGRGLVVLPEKRAGRPVGRRTQVPMTERGEAGRPVRGTARDLGRLEMERVETEEARLCGRKPDHMETEARDCWSNRRAGRASSIRSTDPCEPPGARRRRRSCVRRRLVT